MQFNVLKNAARETSRLKFINTRVGILSWTKIFCLQKRTMAKWRFYQSGQLHLEENWTPTINMTYLH